MIKLLTLLLTLFTLYQLLIYILESFIFLLITKWKNYLLIYCQPSIKKREIIIDMTNSFLAIYIKKKIFILLSQFRLPTKIAIAEIEKNITF